MHPYTREIFAKSLFHIGEHLFVPSWNIYVLKRQILINGDVVGYDATGVYPITILSSSSNIESGLKFLRDAGLISIVMVLDDFHRPEMNIVNSHFSLSKKLKTHYVFDPSRSPIIYDKHHRYELRQAHKNIRTEIIDLSHYMDQWISLYASLSDKHHLKGTHDFPLEHFKALSEINGVVTFGAFLDNQLVSCHIWVEYEGFAHSHLAASNEKGYIARAAYALNDFALNHFKNYSIVNFGGGAGLNDEENGLSKFKKGFSNRESDAIICGAILDQSKYDSLVTLNRGLPNTNFFPAYRAPQNGDLK